MILVEAAESFAAEIRSLAQSGVTVADDALGHRLSSSFDRLSEGTTLLHEWQVVMAVTFAETFLHDVLVECAAADPTLVARSELSAAYEEVASAESLDALKLSMYSKWARSFVDDGGPRRWSERLTRMGVRNLPVDVTRLEEAWGVRHVIVHRAGVVSSDFVRRHPNFGAKPGQHVTLTPTQVIGYVELIDAFVRPIDASFAERIATRNPALRAHTVGS